MDKETTKQNFKKRLQEVSLEDMLELIPNYYFLYKEYIWIIYLDTAPEDELIIEQDENESFRDFITRFLLSFHKTEYEEDDEGIDIELKILVNDREMKNATSMREEIRWNISGDTGRLKSEVFNDGYYEIIPKWIHHKDYSVKYYDLVYYHNNCSYDLDHSKFMAECKDRAAEHRAVINCKKINNKS